MVKSAWSLSVCECKGHRRDDQVIGFARGFFVESQRKRILPASIPMPTPKMEADNQSCITLSTTTSDDESISSADHEYQRISASRYEKDKSATKQQKTTSHQTASSRAAQKMRIEHYTDTDASIIVISDDECLSSTTDHITSDSEDEHEEKDEDEEKDEEYEEIIAKFDRSTELDWGNYTILETSSSECTNSAPEAEEPPTLSREQEFIVEMAVEKGENIFFTGAAGFGKSFTLNIIIERLKSKYPPESVAVTAMTGVAALQIGGLTLHSFAGIGLGNKEVKEHCAIILSKKAVHDRWLNTKVLVIDEVSMLNAELFDKVESIARTIRKSSKPFGGIQVILCGDFFQLPPVRKRGFAFESETWPKVIGSNMVELTQILGQKDGKFMRILNQLRKNQLTSDSIKILKSLDRPLPPRDDGMVPTELFSRKDDVKEANNMHLNALPGKEVVYTAEDQAKTDFYLVKLQSNCIAPDELRLRVGAQVMLLCNLDISAGLVNGTMGQVVGIDPKLYYPIVKFTVTRGGKESKIIAVIGRHSWTVGNSKGEILMERRQIPLALAWAWSIHKSQGQTFSYLKVNLRRIFENGQVYTALSRAVSLEQLQVVGFSESLVGVDPKVVDFYERIAAKQSKLIPEQ